MASLASPKLHPAFLKPANSSTRPRSWAGATIGRMREIGQDDRINRIMLSVPRAPSIASEKPGKLLPTS